MWVRERLDAVVGTWRVEEPERLGATDAAPVAPLRGLRSERPGGDTGGTTAGKATPRPVPLVPLPAARRRRGLTAIKGLFQGVLSTLEFVRPGVTREELIDFLRASSPETKVSSLGVAINAFQGELGVIRLVGDRYVLTEQGENALESQDATYLADWLLTRILGVDRALVELRDRGALPPSELLSVYSVDEPRVDFELHRSGDRQLVAVDGSHRDERAVEACVDVYKAAEWAARIHWAPGTAAERTGRARANAAGCGLSPERRAPVSGRGHCVGAERGSLSCLT